MPRPEILTFSVVAKKYLSQRSVSAAHQGNVKRIAGRVSTISAERINAYLRSRLEQVSAVTVRSERTILMSLWRDAYEQGLVDELPRGVMRIKARKPPTRAWTVEQLRHGIEQTHAHDGRRLRSGADKGLLLRTWMLLGYECGSRHGDLWRLTGDNLDGDVLRWTQSKTGDGIVKVLSPACVAACREMLKDSPDGRILGWACKPRQAMRLMRLHLDACGLPGTSKFLRRSGATHIEISSPGKATIHLGHRTASLAAQAYIDWGQVRQHAPQTPVLVSID